MTDKTVFAHPKQRFDERLDESVENRQLKERLRRAEEELEAKERQIEEHFAMVNVLAMEKELARIEFNQIFNVATDGMWIVDDQFCVIKINKALCTILNRDVDEVVGRKCFELFHCSVCGKDHCPMRRIHEGERQVECDGEITFSDTASCFIISASRFQGLDGGLLGMAVSFKDITERNRIAADLKKANEELFRLARIDELTQIANRRGFDERLTKEWLRMAREKMPLSVIIADIDFFKLYNDRYGHLLGDACLTSVAHAMDSCVNRPADLVARFGGEEFAVLLPNTDSYGAFFVAETIRRTVENLMIEHADSPVHKNVTVSLGAATAVPRYDADPRLLLEASDHELYEAKRTGRNRVVNTRLTSFAKNT